MKIAHIVRRYTKAEWGGTETVVENTIREQLALGHQARIFATAALGTEGGYPYFYPYFPLSKADRLALDKKGGSPYAPGLFRAVREWRPDAIHIHASGRLAAAAVKLGRELGVPTVYSLHGGAAVVPPEEMAEMVRPLRHTFPYGGILDRLFGLRIDPIAEADAVVCISRAEERRLKDKYGDAKIHYLPNGVGVINEELREKKAKLRGSGSGVALLDGRRLNIVCISRIDYQKNQLGLVEAVGRLVNQPPPELRFYDIQLTLVGPVTAQWYRERIERRVSILGLKGNFRLVPGLPPGSQELEEEFAKADVFVLPSVHEPFGIAALEAMSHGIPLVAARVGGLQDFVTDGENGLLFDPTAANAVEQLAAAIGKTLEPELARRLVEHGYQTAEKYSWPAIVQRLMKLYA